MSTATWVFVKRTKVPCTNRRVWGPCRCPLVMYLDIYMQDLEISCRPFKYQAGTWNIREDLGNTNPLKYQSRVYSKVSGKGQLEILLSNLGNPLVIPLLPS